jgi:hypothetical protein
LITASCGYATVADPNENRYEIFASEQSYGDVVKRLKGLVDEQKFLSWITRSTDCMERTSNRNNRWMFTCGFRGTWCDWCNDARPYHIFKLWGIVEPMNNGSRILMTRAPSLLFTRFHPNTEILDKAGIKAVLKGYEKIN